MKNKVIATVFVVGTMVLVALLRQDLVLLALNTTAANLARGGPARAKLLFEIGLFAGILWLTLRLIPEGFNPRRDAVIALAAAVLGFCAEAWGTRTRLWVYYTLESPPLWIVPAWPLGALVIHRVSERIKGPLLSALGRPAAGFSYRALAAAALAIFAVFSRPVLFSPAALALGLFLAAVLFIDADPQRDLPILLTGILCVFFADFWGTTNFCWRYHVQRGADPLGLAAGVLFGMFFDSSLVLASVKFQKMIENKG